MRNCLDKYVLYVLENVSPFLVSQVCLNNVENIIYHFGNAIVVPCARFSDVDSGFISIVPNVCLTGVCTCVSWFEPMSNGLLTLESLY